MLCRLKSYYNSVMQALLLPPLAAEETGLERLRHSSKDTESEYKSRSFDFKTCAFSAMRFTIKFYYFILDFTNIPRSLENMNI